MPFKSYDASMFSVQEIEMTKEPAVSTLHTKRKVSSIMTPWSSSLCSSILFSLKVMNSRDDLWLFIPCFFSFSFAFVCNVMTLMLILLLLRVLSCSVLSCLSIRLNADPIVTQNFPRSFFDEVYTDHSWVYSRHQMQYHKSKGHERSVDFRKDFRKDSTSDFVW